MKRILILISALFFLLLIANAVNAISISPASVKISFSQNFEKNYTFRTDVSDTAGIYIEGPFDELNISITLMENKVSEDGSFVIKVKLPSEISPGKHELFVGVADSFGGGFIGGIIHLRAPIVIKAPFPITQGEMDFTVYDMNINETANFNVKINNTGQVDIKNATGTIGIYNNNNILVETIFTEKITVQNKTNKTLKAFFNASKHASGKYKAIANVSYNGQSEDGELKLLSEKLEASFIIGTIVEPKAINIGPKVNDIMQISVNCTDAFGLSSVWYSNNATGSLENKSSLSFAFAPLASTYTVNHTVASGTVKHQFTCYDIFNNSVQSSELIYSSSTNQEMFHDDGEISANGKPIFLNSNLSDYNWTYQNHYGSDKCDGTTCSTRYTNAYSTDPNNIKMLINYNRDFGGTTGARGARWWIDLSDYLTDRTAFSIEMDAAPQDYCPKHYPSIWAETGGDCIADMSIKLVNGSIYADGVNSPNIESQSSCDIKFDIPTCLNGKQTCDNQYTPKHLFSSCSGSQTVRSNETGLGNFEYDMWIESNKMHKIQGTFLKGAMSWYVDGKHFFTHTTTMDLPKILMLKCGRASSLDNKGIKHVLSCLFDNVRVCKGANNCTTADKRAPFVLDITTNNTTPYANDVLQITSAATDYGSIKSIYYADNSSGTFQNRSFVTGLSDKFLNYSLNITNNASSKVVGTVFTFIDSSNNSIQSDTLLYTNYGFVPKFDFNLTSKNAGVYEEFTYDINCSDVDNNNINFFDNSTYFDINISSGLIKFTPTASGVLPVEIVCSDSLNNISQSFYINITGIDLDKDGIYDKVDFLRGKISDINTNMANLSISINSSKNISKTFRGRHKLEFYQKGLLILEFNFNFSSKRMLNFVNMSILNASTSTLGGIIISGIDLEGTGNTKTVYLEKVNQGINGICIKDEEITSINNITNSCNGDNEFKVECDASVQNGYTCTYNSSTSLFKITGLKHTGIEQLDYSKPGEETNGGGGGGSGGGGGGGGGGTTATSSGTEKIHFYSSISNGQEIKINVKRDAVAFTKAEITVNKDLESVTITIRSLEENDASSTIDNAYQYLEVETDGITDDDIGNVIIEFKINNSWFDENNFDAETVALNRYNNGWKKLSTKKISESESKTSYQATSPGFSLFAITADTHKKTETGKIEEVDVDKTLKAEAQTTTQTKLKYRDSFSLSRITGNFLFQKNASLGIGALISFLIVAVGLFFYFYFIHKD